MDHSLRRWRLPLLASLLVVVALELATHRVMLQFLKPKVLQPPSDAFRLINNGIGPLVFFFASLLALAICSWTLIRIERDERLFPLPWRIVIGLFACVFLPICAVGAFVSPAGLGTPSHSLLELHPYLDFCFAPMLGAVASGIALRRGPLLPKIGVGLALVPLLAFAYYSYRFALLVGDEPAEAAIYQQLKQLSVVPQWTRLVVAWGGLWVFLCFYPLLDLVEPPRAGRAPGRGAGLGSLRRTFAAPFELGPLLSAVGVVVVVGAWWRLDYSTARVAADAALAIDLPAPAVGSLGPLLSLGLFVLTVAGLAWRAGPTRTVALGLLCLAVAALRLAQPLHDEQLTEPLYYLLAVLGLLALAVGIAGAWERWEEHALAAASPAIPDARWRAFLESLRETLAAQPDTELALEQQTEGRIEDSALQGRWQGLPMSLSFARQSQRLQQMSWVIGEPLEQRPDWSVTLASGPRLEAEGQPPEQRLEIRDRAALSDRLLRDEMSEQLRQLVRGQVDLWLHVGVRYTVRVTPQQELGEVVPAQALAGPGSIPPAQRLEALGELLHELARRAGLQR
jgi:hypothetical protein